MPFAFFFASAIILAGNRRFLLLFKNLTKDTFCISIIDRPLGFFFVIICKDKEKSLGTQTCMNGHVDRMRLVNLTYFVACAFFYCQIGMICGLPWEQIIFRLYPLQLGILMEEIIALDKVIMFSAVNYIIANKMYKKNSQKRIKLPR